MGQQYSHLSSEERILIEKLHCEQHLSIRRTAERIGRDKSTVSRELRRGLWFASNENGSYRPYRPKRLKTGPWTGGCRIAGPAGARPTAGAPNRAGATARHADACGRGWPNGRVAAGRRRPSAAGRASRSPTTPPCACARRPSTVGSTPTVIAVSAGRAAFHAAAGGGAGVAAGGRRVSRFPDGFPSPDTRRGIRRRTARIAGPTGVLHL